jgi:ABC-2 type transport system ATP-binding protein
MRNGAGKSTTMRVILGLDAPDTGQALVDGRRYQSLRRPAAPARSLLDAAALQPGRTGRNHLRWLARSQGLPGSRVDKVIAQVGLEKAARRKAGGYSLGMRQRLGIAAALLGDPPILMLDEPFNGMDPEGIIWMRGFLASLAAQGRAVLVSSHLMSELQDTAGRLVIVGRGKVIADTSTRDLLAATSGDRVTLHTTAPDEAMKALARDEAEVATAGPGTLVVPAFSRNGWWCFCRTTPFRSRRCRRITRPSRRHTWNSPATRRSSARSPGRPGDHRDRNAAAPRH